MAEELPKFGSIVHIEIPTKNPEKCKKFYGEVFGWKFQDLPEMNYTLFEAPSAPHGGLRVPGEDDPGGVLNYILVGSVEDASRKVEEAGGTILVPKQEVPTQGWFAIFRDPEGTIQALWQSAPKSEE